MTKYCSMLCFVMSAQVSKPATTSRASSSCWINNELDLTRWVLINELLNKEKLKCMMAAGSGVGLLWPGCGHCTMSVMSGHCGSSLHTPHQYTAVPWPVTLNTIRMGPAQIWQCCWDSENIGACDNQGPLHHIIVLLFTFISHHIMIKSWKVLKVRTKEWLNDRFIFPFYRDSTLTENIFDQNIGFLQELEATPHSAPAPRPGLAPSIDSLWPAEAASYCDCGLTQGKLTPGWQWYQRWLVSRTATRYS